MYPYSKFFKCCEQQVQSLILFCETEQVLILTSLYFPAQKYQIESRERAFVNKIIQSTTANPKNPARGLWRAVGLEVLGENICSARVTDKHRVILICRYIPEIKKLVLFFIADDPNHKYRLDRIKNIYQQVGYAVGATEHWKVIMNSKRITIPQTPTNHVMKQKDIFTNETHKLVMGSNGCSSPDSHANKELINNPMQDSSCVIGQTVCEAEDYGITVFPETTPEEKIARQLVPQHNTAGPQSLTEDKYFEGKKQQTKKMVNSIPSEIKVWKSYGQILGDISKNSDEDQDLRVLCGLFQKSTTYTYIIIERLLNLGMNPSLCDKNGRSLLAVAITTKNTAVIKLLLNRGADLTYPDTVSGYTTHIIYYVLANFPDDKEILKPIISKLKENDSLNDNMESDMPPLWLAVELKSLIAVQVLFQAGASHNILVQGTTLIQNTIKKAQTDSGYKPLLKLLHMLERVSQKNTAETEEIEEDELSIEQCTSPRMHFAGGRI